MIESKKAVGSYRIITVVLTLAMLLSFATFASAATNIRMETNGNAKNYSAGAVLALYGCVESKIGDEAFGVPNTPVIVSVVNTSKNEVIFSAQTKTGGKGYFRTNFNLPNNVRTGEYIEIRTTALGETFTQGTTVKAPRDVDMFLGYTFPASLTKNPPHTISENSKELGLVFGSNVNYFNNREGGDLQDIGVNSKNEDCFALYEDSTNKRVSTTVNLLKRQAEDSGKISAYYATDGRVISKGDPTNNTTDRNIIRIKIKEKLKKDTLYRLEISKELSSNNSAKLGENKLIYFRTEGSDRNDDIGGRTAGGGGGAAAVKENNVELKFNEDGTATISKNDIGNADNVLIKGNDLTVKINKAALKAFGTGADAVVTVKKIEGAVLAEQAHKWIGNRPIYDISITAGSKKITDFAKGKITISIPYMLKDGEKATHIVAYHIDNDGIAKKIEGSRYNPSIKAVTFTVNHLSYYAVGYTDTPVAPAFTDVPEWAEEYIYYLADRNIVNGKGDGLFAPNDNITRAEFATILARMSGDDLSKFTESQFNDVKTDDWFMKSVAWASKQGVTKGGADGNYHPGANISRQEMATMLHRYAENVLKKPLPNKYETVVFADESHIAGFAKIPVAAMQRAGIINGKGNNMFAPLDSATRAEAAKMIAVMMQLQ